MLLRLALKEAGMTLADIEVIPMDPSTVVTAFVSGQVDAAGIWYPVVDVIKQRVPELKELRSNEDFFPEIAFPSSFIVSDEMADDAEVIKTVNEIGRASGWERVCPYV